MKIAGGRLVVLATAAVLTCGACGSAATAGDLPAATAYAPSAAVVAAQSQAPPVRRGGPTVAEVGTAYEFDLYTHCGVRGATFSGQQWTAVNPTTEQPAQKRPDGSIAAQGDPYTPGTMTLVGPGLLRFAFVGGTADFIRGGGSPAPCA
jgi:hypothetical protein